MMPVVKGSPPHWLEHLRRNARGKSPNQAYEMLDAERKQELRSMMAKEQRELCVYCMCKLPSDCGEIEHLFPRNPNPPVDRGQALDYNNLFLSCSGEKKDDFGRRDATCGKSKRNTVLRKVNPLDASTLSSIYYKNNGEIHATDADAEWDLTETLNLNCHALVSARRNVLSPVAKCIENIKDSRGRMEMCESLLRYYDSDKAEIQPFLGILVYYLKKLLQ